MPALIPTVALFASLAAAPSPRAIVDRMLDSDPWGLSGAEVTAHATLSDASGPTRRLEFQARSRKIGPQTSKSVVRFLAPADVNGVGFLQIQKQSGDDDRFLYLPELKKARRVAGSLRSGAFMRTEFSYADLDRRDIRDSKVRLLGEESISKFPCWHLEVLPVNADAQYGKIELWVRKDNFVPLKNLMFSKGGVLMKTLQVKEIRRIGDKWFTTRTVMTNHETSRSTELVLDVIDPKQDFPDQDFTVRALEKA